MSLFRNIDDESKRTLAQRGPESTVFAGLVMILVLVLAPQSLTAHEIRPAVADIAIGAEQATIEIRLSFEPLIAGIDMAGIDDTDNSPKASNYDALRALPAGQLAQAFRDAWPGLAADFKLASDGKELALDLKAVEAGPLGNSELARDSRITLRADLPPGDAPVTFGWAARFGPVVVRQVGAGEDAYTGYLTDGARSEPLPRSGYETESAWQVFQRYIVIGFTHIVPKGLDHILFVLGLFLLSTRVGPLVGQVTLFTLAHTVTLALATLGIVSVPAAVVEPLIAASIVYVAIENVFHQRMNRWRMFVVFGFGLLHGLGFASVLGDIGLAPARFLSGLIGFNVGVEFGQLAVIGTAYLLLALPFRGQDWYRRRIAIPGSIAIAAVGAFWVVERIAF